jgi:hypothetical protein
MNTLEPADAIVAAPDPDREKTFGIDLDAARDLACFGGLDDGVVEAQHVDECRFVAVADLYVNSAIWPALCRDLGLDVARRDAGDCGFDAGHRSASTIETSCARVSAELCCEWTALSWCWRCSLERTIWAAASCR